MKSNRPVNLDLTSMHFPVTAVVSILHRISGVVLFLLIPLLLWMWQYSLSSAEGFTALQQLLVLQAGVRLLLWIMVVALLYHLSAGIRHLLMDLGFGEKLCYARLSAKFVIGIVAILSLLVGVILW